MLDFFRVIPKKRTIRVNRKSAVLFNNPPNFMKVLFGLGSLLFVLSLGYILYLYEPLLEVLVKYQIRSKLAATNQTETPVVYPTPTMAVKPDLSAVYSITIPKISANARVIKEVSPFDKAEYIKVLEKDVVAAAKGTNLPGSGLGKSIYIFAHSTQQGLGMVRKNAIFYLLGDLKNDDVIFVDYQGKNYSYKVYDQKIVAATDIEYLEYSDEEKEVLILQTCWPIGTDWKRWLVFASRVI
ncbi:MAG: sortase [Candidatus Shapirobacteria bacterium]